MDDTPITTGILRTPEHCFAGLADFVHRPRYVDVGGLRMHYVACGPAHGAPVVLLHGEPTWSYLYRHMIAALARAGHRVLAPDLIGFGRSDKPAAIEAHRYARHVDWLWAWMDALDLSDVCLFCQDWGAMIGLRLVAEQPERFARVHVANGYLPDGQAPLPWLFHAWQTFARVSPVFPVGALVQAGTRRWLSRAERLAYAAPFPDARYMAGPRALPRLIPLQHDDPQSLANRAVWQALARFSRPFHTCFSTGDPVSRGADAAFRIRVAGAADTAHVVIDRARHFIQEDRPDALVAFMQAVASTP